MAHHWDMLSVTVSLYTAAGSGKKGRATSYMSQKRLLTDQAEL